MLKGVKLNLDNIASVHRTPDEYRLEKNNLEEQVRQINHQLTQLPVTLQEEIAKLGKKYAVQVNPLRQKMTSLKVEEEQVPAKRQNLQNRRHKLEMEQRVLDVKPDAVMLRAEWMYDYPAERSNYLRMLLNEKQVLTFGKQYRGITYLREVAENMPKIFMLPGGVYNFGSETKQTMYDITCEMLHFLKSDRKPEEVPPAHNLWMDCTKAKERGILFSDAKEGLKRCLKDYHLAKDRE